MRILSLIVITTIVRPAIFAQLPSQYNPLNIGGSTFVYKNEIPLVKPQTVGSTYLDEDWTLAAIVLSDGSILRGLNIRIEVEQNQVEINYDGNVRHLDLTRVERIELGDSAKSEWILCDARRYAVDAEPLKGIAWVHRGTTYNLVKQVYIEVLRANYNVALDVGSRADRKLQREKLYVDSGKGLVPVKGSSRRFAQRLGIDKERALLIISEHDLDLSVESDLITLVDLL